MRGCHKIVQMSLSLPGLTSYFRAPPPELRVAPNPVKFVFRAPPHSSFSLSSLLGEPETVCIVKFLEIEPS
jgi:hypothetical protein